MLFSLHKEGEFSQEGHNLMILIIIVYIFVTILNKLDIGTTYKKDCCRDGLYSRLELLFEVGIGEVGGVGVSEASWGGDSFGGGRWSLSFRFLKVKELYTHNYKDSIEFDNDVSYKIGRV